jgi:hypothetical protein
MLKLLKGGSFLEFVCVELATGVVLDVQLAARSCLVRTLEFLLNMVPEPGYRGRILSPKWEPLSQRCRVGTRHLDNTDSPNV